MAKKKVTNRLQQIGSAGARTKTPAPMPGRPSETQLVELGMFVSTTLFGTLVLAVLAVIFGIKAIENHLETAAMQVISQEVAVAAEADPSVATRTEVSVEATATDLHLRGTVGLEEYVDKLPNLVEGIEGSGNITTELEYAPPVDFDIPDITAAPITVTWVDGTATIIGEVSSEANQTLLVSTLEDLFPGQVDATGLAVKDGAPSERDWISSVVGIIKIGAGTLPEGKVFINSSERLLQMSGEYETRQERADAEADVEALVEATTFDFVNGLSIPEPPPFTIEDVEDLQASIDDLIEGKVVEFELNSDRLTPAGIALLDEILAALEQFPNVPIEIAGHTDNQGNDADNLALSERRAQAALDYFVSNGQDPARFVVEGYGEEFPVASNDTAEGRARNRRIEFKALEE